MRVSIGREDLVIASYFDLTAQRLATRTLEDRKLELERIVSAAHGSELSRVLDAMPDRYFRIRQDGTVIDFRIGPPRGQLHRHQPAAGPAHRATCCRRRRPTPLYAVHQRGHREQGARDDRIRTAVSRRRDRHFEARTLPLGSDQVIMFIRNITDRHSLEADRERARLNAVALANAKSEFLANMSHEIRTPLNGLLGLAQIGLRDTADARTGGTFAAILNSGRLLLGIVNDVLDFSKIEVGKLRVEQRPDHRRTRWPRRPSALLRDRADREGRSRWRLVFDAGAAGALHGRRAAHAAGAGQPAVQRDQVHRSTAASTCGWASSPPSMQPTRRWSTASATAASASPPNT